MTDLAEGITTFGFGTLGITKSKVFWGLVKGTIVFINLFGSRESIIYPFRKRVPPTIYFANGGWSNAS